jgi:hypothetical protein
MASSPAAASSSRAAFGGLAWAKPGPRREAAVGAEPTTRPGRSELEGLDEEGLDLLPARPGRGGRRLLGPAGGRDAGKEPGDLVEQVGVHRVAPSWLTGPPGVPSARVVNDGREEP